MTDDHDIAPGIPTQDEVERRQAYPNDVQIMQGNGYQPQQYQQYASFAALPKVEEKVTWRAPIKEQESEDEEVVWPSREPSRLPPKLDHT